MFCYYQQGWCEIPGTADEVKTKLRMRQEGAIKRDRAMAYSLSTQVMKLTRSNTHTHTLICLLVKIFNG
jgi:hypothetical protein